MTKLIWLLVLAVSAVTANDIQGVLSQPADKPQEDVVPMIQVDPMPPQFEKNKMENSKDLKPETFLRPIGPIFPSFLQPGIFSDQFNPLRNGELNLNQDGGESMDQPEKGILTIILVKSGHDQDDVIEDPAVMTKDSKLEKIKESAEQKFKTLTQFILHDLFGSQTGDLLQESQPERVHLLGGSDDPDQFIRISGGDGFAENDFIRFVKGNEMPVMSDDLGRHREFDLNGDYQHAGQKCNFMKFLRLKAHVHYRTIVHLFFISGIILIVLMFLSLALRVNKRRNALQHYANKRNQFTVASIDSAAAKQREAEGLSPRPQRAFRLGNLMMTFEQRMAPPAYDQVLMNYLMRTKNSEFLLV